jgi:L-fuconolactonase
MLRIDAHQHFWDPARGDYPWMAGDAMAPIRKVFGPDELRPLAQAKGINRTIAVQCRHDLEETRDMLRIAAEDSLVVGVVGWVDLTGATVARDIADLRAAPGGGHLVGIRHIVHDEADPKWLDRADVNAGLAEVFSAGLSYDLLLKPPNIASAIRCVAAHPGGRFIVDHGAKPRIGDGVAFDAEWSDAMAPLAALPNTWCKLSGLVTEADWHGWQEDDIAPYIARLVALFGKDRLMFGSDWPVCTLAAPYGAVADLAATALPDMNADAFYHHAARAAYALTERQLRP